MNGITQRHPKYRRPCPDSNSRDRPFQEIDQSQRKHSSVQHRQYDQDHRRTALEYQRDKNNDDDQRDRHRQHRIRFDLPGIIYTDRRPAEILCFHTGIRVHRLP